MAISRRAFVGYSAALAASAALPRHLTARASSRVLVVGAGAAGLSAAYELQRAGHTVTVFEASGRPGGRFYTIREPFSDGLYAEAGAQGLVSHNPGVEYAREFGLELTQAGFASGAALIVVRGQTLVVQPGESPNWPLPLNSEEVGLSHFALGAKYFRGPVDALAEIDLLPTGAPLRPEVLHLDQRSMEDLLNEAGASDAARELLDIGYFRGYLREPAPVSLLQFALERGGFRGMSAYYRIAGGNDRLLSELADRIGNAVRYRSPVRSVRQGPTGVSLGVEGPDGFETVEGDFAILTPPPPVLRDLVFEPGLDARVMRSFQELHPVPATRVFVEAESRFWESGGFSGSVTTDGPVGLLSHATGGQPGPRGVLDSYTYGDEARVMANLSESDRLNRLRSAIESVYPGGTDLSPRGTSHAWGTDPWVRCNFVTFQPGQVSEFLPPMREAQGRVYLAGDTVGGIPGYSHAAFWSGRDVAARIIEASG